jgi:hypothetical protein
MTKTKLKGSRARKIQDVVQSNIKFVSLKEQSLFYCDILDDDSIHYYDVEVRQGSL